MISTKYFSKYTQLQIARGYNNKFKPFTLFSHGLLAGFCIAHKLFIVDAENTKNYVKIISDANLVYTCTFSLLLTFCIVGVLDGYDLAHLDIYHYIDLFLRRKRVFIVPLYLILLLIHLIGAGTDEKLNLAAINNDFRIITNSDVKSWETYCYNRMVLACINWAFIILMPYDELLTLHLNNLEKYEDEENI